MFHDKTGKPTFPFRAARYHWGIFGPLGSMKTLREIVDVEARQDFAGAN